MFIYFNIFNKKVRKFKLLTSINYISSICVYTYFFQKFVIEIILLFEINFSITRVEQTHKGNNSKV